MNSTPSHLLLTPENPFWEKCARHQNAYTTRFVAHLFLCDDCGKRLAADCLNSRPPMFRGLPIEGFCGLCNQRRPVQLWQWFVCPICLNVILSYPKSFAASEYLRIYWATEIRPAYSNLRLEETEVVRLSPFVPGRWNKEKIAGAITTLDFAVFDDSLDRNKPAFMIEMKAGPGSIEEIAEFQLDINDSNDLATVCNNSGVPAYIFHVQVVEQYWPPTRHSVGKGIWWTDAFCLGENLIRVKPRRGEDKNAGYYRAAAFKTMKSFSEELKECRYLKLRERLAKEPLPIR